MASKPSILIDGVEFVDGREVGSTRYIVPAEIVKACSAAPTSPTASPERIAALEREYHGARLAYDAIKADPDMVPGTKGIALRRCREKFRALVEAMGGTTGSEVVLFDLRPASVRKPAKTIDADAAARAQQRHQSVGRNVEAPAVTLDAHGSEVNRGPISKEYLAREAAQNQERGRLAMRNGIERCVAASEGRAPRLTPDPYTNGMAPVQRDPQDRLAPATPRLSAAPQPDRGYRSTPKSVRDSATFTIVDDNPDPVQPAFVKRMAAGVHDVRCTTCGEKFSTFTGSARQKCDQHSMDSYVRPDVDRSPDDSDDVDTSYAE